MLRPLPTRARNDFVSNARRRFVAMTRPSTPIISSFGGEGNRALNLGGPLTRPYAYGQRPVMLMGRDPCSIGGATREMEPLSTMQLHPYEQYCSELHWLADQYGWLRSAPIEKGGHTKKPLNGFFNVPLPPPGAA